MRSDTRFQLPDESKWTTATNSARKSMIEYAYTRHQTARGSRPDAVGTRWVAACEERVDPCRLVRRLPSVAHARRGVPRGRGVGSRFPTLMRHSDSDGVWSPVDSSGLLGELTEIRKRYGQTPSAAVVGDWQKRVAKDLGLKPTTLAESFIDVDGEPLLDRLLEFARASVRHQRPISFQ